MSEHAVVVPLTANTEALEVPVPVDPVRAPAHRGGLRGEVTQELAVEHRILVQLGVNPRSLITLGVHVVGDQLQGLHVFHADGEAGDLLPRLFGGRPNKLSVSFHLEVGPRATAAAVTLGASVVDANARAEGRVLLVHVVDEFGGRMGKYAVVVSLATNNKSSLVPRLVDRVQAPADGGRGRAQVSEVGEVGLRLLGGAGVGIAPLAVAELRLEAWVHRAV